MLSSRHLAQYKGNFYTMDEVLIANLPPTKARLQGCGSNRSVFMSFSFQIDPLWFAFS